MSRFGLNFLILVVIPTGVVLPASADGDVNSARLTEDDSAGLHQSVASSNEPKRLLRRSSTEKDVPRVENRSPQFDKPVGLFDLFWPLGIVLGLIFFCVLAVRRWMPRASRWGGGQGIKVLSRHYLSGKQSLCLLRLGRRLVLVGITPDRVSTLVEIADPDEVAEVVSAVERGRPGSFTSLFSHSTSRDQVGLENSNDNLIEDERLTSSQRLARTENNVHELVKRVRALSSGVRASAEPT